MCSCVTHILFLCTLISGSWIPRTQKKCMSIIDFPVLQIHLIFEKSLCLVTAKAVSCVASPKMKEATLFIVASGWCKFSFVVFFLFFFVLSACACCCPCWCGWVVHTFNYVSWRTSLWSFAYACTLTAFQDAFLAVNPFTATMSLENDQQKCEIWNLWAFRRLLFFALARERIFIKTYSVYRRCVTGPANVLFAGASVHLSARKSYRLGPWRG